MPGLYGYVSATKWLSEIELTTREAFDGYWVPLDWAKDGPILTESRIDYPSDGAILAAGQVDIDGLAWAPTEGSSASKFVSMTGPADGIAEPRHLQGDLGAMVAALAGDAGQAHHSGPSHRWDGRRSDRHAGRSRAGRHHGVPAGAGVGGLSTEGADEFDLVGGAPSTTGSGLPARTMAESRRSSSHPGRKWCPWP